MQYEELRYIPDEEDPSLTLETERLVMKVIDNTGLLAPETSSTPHFKSTHHIAPMTHHLGYHGLRAVWDKEEKRNLVEERPEVAAELSQAIADYYATGQGGGAPGQPREDPAMLEQLRSLGYVE